MSGSEKPDFSNAMAVGRELELKLPDSQVVRDAYTQANAESQPWLFNHVVRSWLFGAKLAERRTLKPDAELVAVSVLLHDLGLARGGAPDRCFEVVGADAGRAFALSHNMGERRAETVWDSIALHTTASIAHHKGTDVACCQHGIACDFGGVGFQELSDGDKKPKTIRIQRETISSQTLDRSSFLDIHVRHPSISCKRRPLRNRRASHCWDARPRIVNGR